MENTMQEKIMTMMNSQLEKLEEMLSSAMHDFANVALQECEPRWVFEKRTKCKIIEAQIQTVKDMMREISSMKYEIKMPQFANM